MKPAHLWAPCAFALLLLAANTHAQPLHVWPSPLRVQPNEAGELEVELVVVNTAERPAHDVVLVDELPVGTELVAARPAPRRDGQRLSWGLGELAPGGSVRVRLVLRGGVDVGAGVVGLVGSTSRARRGPPVQVFAGDPALLPSLEPTLDADSRAPEVLAVVSRLGGDPDALLAFVADEIRYEPYRGSLRGARGALRARAGNAWDQASLAVALLRAAGVPARYATATLSDELAADLIASLFGAPVQPLTPAQPPAAVLAAVGQQEALAALLGRDFAAAVADVGDGLGDLLYADPTSDPELLDVVREHAFVQHLGDGHWLASDPARRALPLAAEETLLEIDDGLRHRVDVTLSAEVLNPAFGFPGGGGSERLRAELRTVELVGRTLALRHQVFHDVRPGLIYSSVAHTYVPTLELDGSERAVGEAFSELFTNYPAASEILTGLFLDVRLHGPGAEPVDYRHPVLDRLGAAVRSPGPDGAGIELAGLQGQPAVTNLDVTVIHVAPGATPRLAQLRTDHALASLTSEARRLAPEMEALVALGEQDALSFEEQLLVEARSVLYGELHVALGQSLGEDFLRRSEQADRALSEHLRLRAFTARPRLVFVDLRGAPGGPGARVDVADMSVTVLGPAAVGAGAARTFATTRGLVQSMLEGEVLGPLSLREHAVVSLGSVFDAAQQQGVALRTIAADNVVDELLRLDLPAEAVARIQAAVAADRAVLTPERPVWLGDRQELVWLEYDGHTGHLIAVGLDGHHPATVEWANVAENVLTFGMGFVMGAVAGYYMGIAVACVQVLEHHAGGQGKLAPYPDWAPITCFWPAAGIPGFALFEAIENGAIVSMAMKVGIFHLLGKFTEFIAKEAAGGKGLASFIYGMKVGVCVGFMAARQTVAALLQALDPPLSPLATAFGERLVLPAGLVAHSLDVEAAEALRPLPPAPAGTPVRLSGALSLRFEGQAALPGGALRVMGPLTGPDGPLGDGPHELRASWIELDGPAEAEGRGSLTAYPDGRVGADFEELQLRAAGAGLRVYGAQVWQGGGAAGWYMADAADLELEAARGGGAALPPTVLVETGDGALGLGPEAFAGLAGAVALSAPGATVEAAAERSLRLSGLPGELVLERGATGRLPVALLSSTPCAGELSAEGPAGWRLSWEGTELLVDPAPGTAADDGHALSLAGVCVDALGAEVGVTVPVRIIDGPGATLSLQHAPLFTTPAATNQAPLVFRAGLTHGGPVATTYTLGATVTAGFEAHMAASTLHLRPGERGAVYLSVDSTDALPAPGAPLTLQVEASADGETTATELQWSYPALFGASALFEPHTLQLEPGEAGAVRLRLASTGNTPGTLQVVAQVPDALELSGLPDTVDVQPGEALELPLEIRLAGHATAGLPYIAAVRLLRGGVVESATLVRVDAIGAEANAAIAAAAAADALGDAELRDALIGVATRTEQAAFRCDGADLHYLGQALGVLVVELSDPVYAGLRATLVAYQAALGELSCAELELDALAATLRDLLPLLQALRDHDFRVALEPEATLLLPGVEGTLRLDVELRGTQPTTVALRLDGVEGEVLSPVQPDPLLEDHPVVVRPQRQGRLPVRVVAHALEAPILRREVPAVVVVEPQWVRVTSLGAEPPFALPGAHLRVFADLFNVPNMPQQLDAWLVLRDADGGEMWSNEEPISLTLPVSAALRRHELATVPTFGSPVGVYTLGLRLHLPGTDEPVPGGEASGELLLGAPLHAHTAAQPPRLQPGDETVEAVTLVQPRPLNLLPGVGNPTEIQIFATDTAGPAGLVGHPDGSVYFTSFGTERSSDIPGYEAGRTVGRISPAGAVSVVATVAPAVAGLALHPSEGDLYAANVGNPEHVTRVPLPEGETSVYYDFQNQPVQGGGNGENITGLVFDATGNLYATELIRPALFVSYPGERIYRLTPDGDADGHPDLVETYAVGFLSPTDITIDPRTGDLFVCDTGNDRVARVTTREPEPTVTTAIADFDQCQGLEFDALGTLYVVNDTLGEIQVWATEVVDEHTELQGPGHVLLRGLLAPYNLAFGADGDLVTALVDEDTVLRILIDDPAPTPAVALHLEHAARALGLDRGSALPELGADGPTWTEERVSWTTPLPPDPPEGALRFSVRHDLSDLRPGDVAQLSDGGTLRYTVDGAVHELALPPVLAPVDHLVGLAPDRLTLRQGTAGTVTVTLRNHGETEETYALTLQGAPAGMVAELPSEVLVPAGGEVEVTLRLTADAHVPLGPGAYALHAVSASGAEDRAVGELDVVGEGFTVSVEVDPPVVYRGESVTLRMRFAKGAGDTRRGFDSATRGLNNITSNGRELGGLVDFLRGPVVEFERSATLVGPAGSYPFQLHIWEGSADNVVGRTTGQVTILDHHGVTVGADPPLVRTGRGQPFTLTAVLHNEGHSARRVRLDRCCGPAYWQPQFDAGPHELGPGQVLRVPIRMSPNGILVGDYGHRLDAVDLDDRALDASFLATVRIEEPGGVLRLIEPRHVVAEGGAATITARLDRGYNSPGARYRVEVSGPLTTYADPQAAEIDLSAAWWGQVPFRFRGLQDLGPGPWSVRVQAWPLDDPSLVVQELGSVTIPAGGISAAFEPAVVVLPVQPEPTLGVLVVRNHDLGRGQQLTVGLAASADGLAVRWPRELLSLGPGGRAMVPVELTGLQPGDYVVRAGIDAGEGEPTLVSLPVHVLDPARGPRVDGLRTAPDPPLEGTPFELLAEASDPDEEPLSFDADLDGDGTWEIEGWPEGRFLVLAPDDGPWPVRVRVRDREGGSATAEALLQVANVAPAFTTLPSPEAMHREPYEYRPGLYDPGADTVQLALLGPAGANLQDGVLRWVPDREAARAGSAALTLLATDEDGGLSEQTWTVRVVTHNQPPSAPVPIAPRDGEAVGGQTVLQVEPALDPEGDPLSYVFEVAPPGDAAPWQVQSDSPSAAVVLADAGVYGWRALADDGLAAGPFSETVTFVVDPSVANRPPPAPVILEPEAEAGPLPLPVELVWAVTVDPDGDAVVYDLQVALDADFERLLVDEEGLPDAGPDANGELRFVVPDGVGGAGYFGRVRAVDEHAAGPWAERAWDTTNRAPGRPTLLAPVDGAEVRAGPVALEFGGTDDPDGHTLTYQVAVMADVDAVAPLWSTDAAAPEGTGQVLFPAHGEHATYLWTVTAVDEQGLAGPAGGPEEFSVGRPSDNQAPAAPTLLEPGDGAALPVGRVRLVLAPGADPEGEAVTHTVTVWDDDGDEALQIADIAEPGRIEVFAALPEPGAYTWGAQATDARGLAGPSSVRHSLLLVIPVIPSEDLGPQPEPDLGPLPEPDIGTPSAGDSGPRLEPDSGGAGDGALDATTPAPAPPGGATADEGCACSTRGHALGQQSSPLGLGVLLLGLLLLRRRAPGGLR